MVYFVQGEKTGLIKIGKSSNFTRRLANLRNGGPDRLTCLAVIVRAYDDTVYHDRFSNDRVHGEWFKPSEKLMNFINALPTTKYTGMTHGSRSKRFDDAELQDQFSIVMPEPTSEGVRGLIDLFLPHLNLTPKQKNCVVAYVETRDADAAILAAYDCKDSAIAERLKYDIFSRPSILKALSSLLGSNDPKVAKFIQRAAKNERISEAQVRELEESPTSAQPA